MLKINFEKNKFLIMFSDYTCEFPTMDSYCVTLVSGRKSWDMINRIKYSDSIQGVYAMDLQKFSRIISQKLNCSTNKTFFLDN